MSQQSPPRGPGPHRPRMGPTQPATLVLAALVAAALAWLLVSMTYASLPDVPWTPTAVLAGLGVLEGYLALNTRARIQRKPGHPSVDPLAVARFAVLAKASSLVGSIFGGFFVGLLIFLIFKHTDAAHHDLPAAIGGVVGSIILVIAALFLERACRVPKRDDEDENHDDDARSTRP